jgi:phage repressor protein C with HTH and peptisase S24 domain
MGWATGYIERLKSGESVSFRPRGASMVPLIRSGQLCRVEPIDGTTVSKGDIVLCKVKGHEYLHLVKAVQGGRFLIGNNRGGINGWIGGQAIFGRLASVE